MLAVAYRVLTADEVMDFFEFSLHYFADLLMIHERFIRDLVG